MEGSGLSTQVGASYLHRLNLRSRDAPSNAPRISYAEDLRENDEEEYDHDHDEVTQPSSAMASTALHYPP